MDTNKKRQYISDALFESAEVKKQIIEKCLDDIIDTVELLTEAYKNGKKLLLCGNGGSASDCQHIAAELVIRFSADFPRPSMPAIALNTDTSALTAGGNDIGFENTYARIVEGLGNEGDVLFTISTSGNSENLIRAINKAKEKNMKVISLLGRDGGKMKSMCDISMIVPSNSTARIQEGHITIGHIICYLLERELYE